MNVPLEGDRAGPFPSKTVHPTKASPIRGGPLCRKGEPHQKKGVFWEGPPPVGRPIATFEVACGEKGGRL